MRFNLAGRCLGLNVKVSPERLAHNPETGEYEAGACVNLLIGVRGEVEQRPGVEKMRDGAFHSLFSCGDFALAAERNGDSDSLVRIAGDLSCIPVESSLTSGARLDYCAVGDDIFWSNGFQKGIYNTKTGHNRAWEALPSLWPDSGKTYVSVPAGEKLTLHNGRIYAAQGSSLYFTEFGHIDYGGYTMMNPLNHIQFESRILLLRALADGIWVGTAQRICFLAGSDALQFSLTEAAAYPVIEGAFSHAQGESVGEGMSGKVVITATAAGVAILGNSGSFINISKDRIAMPSGLSMGAGYCDDKTCTILAR